MTFGILELVGAILGSTALSALINGLLGRKKSNADASTALVDATLKWAGNLVARIEVLERQLIERDRVIAELRERIAILEANINGGKRPKEGLVS